MDFQLIKPLVQHALSVGNLTSTEQEKILSAIKADRNQDRARLLVELLGLSASSATKAS